MNAQTARQITMRSRTVGQLESILKDIETAALKGRSYFNIRKFECGEYSIAGLKELGFKVTETMIQDNKAYQITWGDDDAKQ